LLTTYTGLLRSQVSVQTGNAAEKLGLLLLAALLVFKCRLCSLQCLVVVLSV